MPRNYDDDDYDDRPRSRRRDDDDDDYDRYRARRDDYDDDDDFYDRPLRREQGGTGMAVTGMILGIVGFVLAITLCLWWLGVICGILGAIFGGIGLAQASRTGQGRGMALTGLILGILAIVAAPLLFMLFWATLVGAAGGRFR